MIGAIVGGCVGLVGAVVVLRFVIGVGATLLRRRGVVRGDEQLALALRSVRDRHTRRLAVAVIRVGDERPVRTATLGCDVDHVFEVGSVSKALTGMLLADAAERGELAMDDLVGDHVEELVDHPVGRQTISALATHRSGLPRIATGTRAVLGLLGYGVLGSNPYVGQSVPFVVARSRKAKLRTRGQRVYSNLGGALAGVVLERATAASYDDLVRDRLATPLGLSHTSARPDAPRRSGRTRRGRWVQPWRLTGIAPAGGVTSSVDDLAALAVAILRRAAPGAQAIDRDDCFWVRERTPSGATVVWHNGMTAGHAAYLGVRAEEGRAVVVLSDVADMRLVTRVARAASECD